MKYFTERNYREISLDPLTLLAEHTDFTEDEVEKIKAEMYNIPSVLCSRKVSRSEIAFIHKKSPKFLCRKESIFYKKIVKENYGTSKVNKGDTLYVYREVNPNGKVKEQYFVL